MSRVPRMHGNVADDLMVAKVVAIPMGLHEGQEM